MSLIECPFKEGGLISSVMTGANQVVFGCDRLLISIVGEFKLTVNDTS